MNLNKCLQNWFKRNFFSIVFSCTSHLLYHDIHTLNYICVCVSLYEWVWVHRFMMSIHHCIPKIRLYTSWSNRELIPWPSSKLHNLTKPTTIKTGTQLSTRYQFTLAIKYNKFHWKYYIDKQYSINQIAKKVYGFVASRSTTIIQLPLAVLNDLQHKVLKLTFCAASAVENSTCKKPLGLPSWSVCGWT